MIRSAILLTSLISQANALLTDINGIALAAGNVDSVDVNWQLIKFNDTRYNGVGVEQNTQRCYATLIKTWQDGPGGTIPASVVDQPAVAVTTWSCLQDFNLPDPTLPATSPDKVMWHRVITNTTFNNFYVMDNASYVSSNGFPAMMPSFATKYNYDGYASVVFSISNILFATGNLTDLIVFQTDQTIRQMSVNAALNCSGLVSLTATSQITFPDPTRCLPRYYPLASNVTSQGANGNPVSVVTGYDIQGVGTKRRASGKIVNAPRQASLVVNGAIQYINDSLPIDSSTYLLGAPTFGAGNVLIAMMTILDTTLNTGPSLLDLGPCFDTTKNFTFNLNMTQCMLTWKRAQYAQYGLKYFNYTPPVVIDTSCNAKCKNVGRNASVALVRFNTSVSGGAVISFLQTVSKLNISGVQFAAGSILPDQVATSYGYQIETSFVSIVAVMLICLHI